MWNPFLNCSLCNFDGAGRSGESIYPLGTEWSQPRASRAVLNIISLLSPPSPTCLQHVKGVVSFFFPLPPFHMLHRVWDGSHAASEPGLQSLSDLPLLPLGSVGKSGAGTRWLAGGARRARWGFATVCCLGVVALWTTSCTTQSKQQQVRSLVNGLGLGGLALWH